MPMRMSNILISIVRHVCQLHGFQVLYTMRPRFRRLMQRGQCAGCWTIASNECQPWLADFSLIYRHKAVAACTCMYVVTMYIHHRSGNVSREYVLQADMCMVTADDIHVF